MRRRPIWLLGCCAGLAWTGCDLHRRAPGVEPETPAELPILASYAGAHSSLKREVRLAVYDPAMLAQLPAEIRPVDFTREMVLFAALGPAPSAGYGIAITGVERRGPRIHVRVVKTYPSPDDRVATVLTSPYSIVIVPRSDAPVAGFDPRWPPDAL